MRLAKILKHYFPKVLKQLYFASSTEEHTMTFIICLCFLLFVQVGKFIQLMSTFFGGLVVAFIKGWKLTLVMLCIIPLLVAAGGSMAMVISKMSSRGQQAYAEAGNVVEETISTIKTVSM